MIYNLLIAKIMLTHYLFIRDKAEMFNRIAFYCCSVLKEVMGLHHLIQGKWVVKNELHAEARFTILDL